MIASNELRKGNIISHDHTIGTVTQLFWDRLEMEIKIEGSNQYRECPYDEVEPIPVTLDILEKCDLVKHRRFYYANVFYSKTGRFTINQLRDNMEISFAVNSTPGIISDQNLFLHQLQNLFFALMHEELVVTL